MSNSFNIDGWDSNPTQRAAERTQLIENYWWVGEPREHDRLRRLHGP